MGDDFQHLAANFQLSFSKVTDYRPHNAPHLVTNAPQALSLWFVNDSKETNQFAMLLLIIPLTLQCRFSKKNLTNAGQWGKASAFRYKWLTFKSQIILSPEWPPTIVDFVIDTPPPPLHHLCLSWLLASFHLVSFAQSNPKKMCLIRIALAASERLRQSNGASREFVT